MAKALIRITNQRVLESHELVTLVAAYSPSGKLLVGAGGFPKEPGTIAAWDARTFDPCGSARGGKHVLSKLAISHDGTTLATACQTTDEIEWWDLETMQFRGCVTILPKPYRPSVSGLPMSKTSVGHMAFSQDDRQLALGCWDCTVKIIDVTSGALSRLESGEARNVDFVHFTRDGVLLTATCDRITVWDESFQNKTRKISLGDNAFWVHAALPDVNFMASLSHLGTLRIWNVESWTYDEYRVSHKGPAVSVVYSPRDRLLAIGQPNGSVAFWDTSTRSHLGNLRLSPDTINSLAFAPDRPALCVVHASSQQILEYEYQKMNS